MLPWPWVCMIGLWLLHTVSISKPFRQISWNEKSFIWFRGYGADTQKWTHKWRLKHLIFKCDLDHELAWRPILVAHCRKNLNIWAKVHENLSKGIWDTEWTKYEGWNILTSSVTLSYNIEIKASFLPHVTQFWTISRY